MKSSHSKADKKRSDRPDPDVLLEEIKTSESEKKRGRLKIFFGMCAGVGKTYAMLQEAQTFKSEGRDAVVGIVETHGRSETDALLKGLELVPLKSMPYRGLTLVEFDIDAVLKRRPDVVLVDELAHSNVPGSRHPKRYQDVQELLDHGIHVYTTLNVQHLESRAATVEEITGVQVRETVPDSILKQAQDIELVDISPSELLKRFDEGKIYAPEGSKQALRNFFRHGNITALREMALRVTAQQVDRQLSDYMRSKKITGPWKSGDRLMVAVSWSPFSVQLVGWTRRMAATMNATWIAIYVETPARLSINQIATLTANLHLAQELGAEVMTIRADDPAAGLLETATQHNITQIVVGKSIENRFMSWLKGGSIVDRLIRNSGNIDIYVVRGDVIPETALSPRLLPRLTLGRQYGMALAAIAAVAAILYAAVPFLNYLSVAMFLLFAVTLLSLWLGRGPVLFAATLSALVWNFFFIPPRYTFHIARFEDFLVFCLYFIIAIVTGTLASRIRLNKEAVRVRETRAAALYDMSRALASVNSMNAIASIAVEQIGRVFDADVAVFLNREGKLSSHPASCYHVDEKEDPVVRWVAENRKPAGKFTNSLPLAEAHYEPLVTSRDSYGVIGVRFRKTPVFTLDQETLLENFISQIAAAVERERFSELRHRAELDDVSEQLYKTLLNSISHEFRTPLAVITGAAGSLLDRGMKLSAKSRKALLGEVRDASNRLDALVENLLNISRLESGRIRPKREWCDVADLFSALQRRFHSDSKEHPMAFVPAPDLPLVYIDPGLAEQAVGSLIQNAVQYTPPKTPIEIRASMSGSELAIAVQDEGPGFPPEAVPHLFEKFYRVPGTATGGTGLGLSISKGLVESMGGSLSAENLARGGALFQVRLPVKTQSANLEAGSVQSG
jgi:two-component system sensor histidine kinase KdpD